MTTSNKWTAVRPVRSRDELYYVVESLVRKRAFTPEDVRIQLLGYRKAREKVRLQVTQRYVSLKREKGPKRRRRPELLTKAEQLIRILRATKLVRTTTQGYEVTPDSTTLLNLKRTGESQADAFFLRHLLNSRYQTYWAFLEFLSMRHELLIPGSSVERNPQFRRELEKLGMTIDVWSFFILRDLFYDFSLLNFANNERGQTMVPLFEISNQESPAFACNIHVGDKVLNFWPHMEQTQFEGFLSQLYWEFSEGHWNRVVELLKIREAFSMKHKIPEREFNELFKENLRRPQKYRVVPSVGFINPESGANYLVKAATLPVGKEGQPYSIFRMEPMRS